MAFERSKTLQIWLCTFDLKFKNDLRTKEGEDFGHDEFCLLGSPCSSSTSTCSLALLRSSQTERLRLAGRLPCHPAQRASGLVPKPCPRSLAWCPPPSQRHQQPWGGDNTCNETHCWQSWNCVTSAEGLDWVSARRCNIAVSGSPPPLEPAFAVACGCWRCWVDLQAQQELHLHPVHQGRRGLRPGQHLGRTWGPGKMAAWMVVLTWIALATKPFHVSSDGRAKELVRFGEVGQ